MIDKHFFKLCLITGASSGIGEALCYLLADQGIDLMISGRDTTKLDKIANQLKDKVKVEIFVANLATREDLSKLTEAIHCKKPDLIINNAGFGLYGDALNYKVEQQLEILAVNSFAVAEITLESAKTLMKSGMKGTILNVSSAAAFQVFPGFAVYSASKTFVNQFSESLDYETKENGIRILAACPGMVKTGFRKRASGVMGNVGDEEDSSVMNASYAAKEIWHQILKGKPIHIFNWRYRLAIFFTRYILPTSIVAKRLYANISKRASK